MTLPFASEAPAPSEPLPLRVLIVDDDELDRLSVRRFAQTAGFALHVRECEDAERALRALTEEDYDCIFLDVNLPTHDGLHVLRTLRQRAIRTPVIVLTGQTEAEVAVELMKSGASDYLAKATLDAERLGQALRSVLRLHRAQEEARQAQEALRASEELNRRVLGASADCFNLLDLQGGILFMSDVGLRILGLTDGSTLVGFDYVALFADADRRAAQDAVTRAREGELARFVAGSTAADGSEQWWDVVVTPVLAADGQPERLLAVARDVTALKQRQGFEQELVGIVSHDLRNPLNAILLGSELLLRRDELDERTVKAVTRIRSASQRAGRMIRDLLDFTQARLGGGIPINPDDADLRALAAHVVEEMALAWPLRQVLLEAEAELRGEWDADRLTQVLTNLLSNALQYSPPESAVTCRVREEAGHGVIEVHNRGPAIPAEVLGRIFEPLQRAVHGEPNPTRSIGLGLYIVKQLVMAHHGTIQVQSSEAEGTLFTVRLPRAQQRR